MARIVLGLASSHTPQLSTPPEIWPLHGENDKKNPWLFDRQGKRISYEEALAVYEQTLHLDPNNLDAWNNKGNALWHLKRYQEALAAYEHTLHLDPNNIKAWYNKGNALWCLKRYKEALAAYEHALHLDSSNLPALLGKMSTLFRAQEN